MNYLFLDIDGVINNTNSRDANKCLFHHVLANLGRPLQKSDLDIDESNMQLVIDLICKYEFKVVITSMWRFGARPKWFQQLFALYGLDISLDRIDMITPQYESSHGMRSEFIESYIAQHGCQAFVCLDDTYEHYNRLLDRLVLTEMKTGFTVEHYKKVVDIMEKLR